MAVVDCGGHTSGRQNKWRLAFTHATNLLGADAGKEVGAVDDRVHQDRAGPVDEEPGQEQTPIRREVHIGAAVRGPLPSAATTALPRSSEVHVVAVVIM
jgi:hypothetical protein